MPNGQFNEVKFAELILYISSKCSADANFGAVKLNKILYYSDFLAYGRFGASITGAEYQHLPQGPAPRKLLPVRARLLEEKALVVESVDAGFGYTQKRTVSLRAPKLNLFSGDEIALVDAVINAFANKNATDVSNLSHLEFGWKATKVRETIDYGTVFISSDEPNEVDDERAAALAAQLEMVA